VRGQDPDTTRAGLRGAFMVQLVLGPGANREAISRISA
jgi:hypothetical protein